MGWIRRLRNTVLGSDLNEQFADEARFHIEQRIDEYVKSGMPYPQAQAKASRRLGNLTLASEQARDVDTIRWIADLGQDVRYALRQLQRDPGFALAAILTLAFGIGAITSIFSVVDTVILRPLSYADARRLVVIDEWLPSVGAIPVNARHFQEWRRTTHAFGQMALMTGVSVNVTDSGEPERLAAARVSPALFSMLGVQPQLGRGFLDSEDVPGRDHVVLISAALWQRRYGADPQVLRHAVSIDGVPHDIVGVLPSSFHFPKLSDLYPLRIVQDQPQIWKPLALRPQELAPISDFNFVSLGRLEAGVSPEQAAAELDGVQKRLSVELPKFLGRPDLHAHVLPLQDRIVGRAKTGLELTLAAVGVVLLIGCVNITNLLLARLSARRRELAVRAALGAGPARLVRQMLAESLTLATFGGACGAVMAFGGIRLILALAPADLPRLDEVHLSTRSFMFTVVISTVVGLVIGISPAWQFGTTNPGEVVAGGTRSTAGRRTGRLRSVLVSAQVALSGVSLITAALLVQSLVNLLNVDRGFDSTHVITVDVNLASTRYPTIEKQIDFVRTAVERLRVLPGAVDVAAANMFPLAGEGSNSTLMRPGTTEPLFDGALGNIRMVNSDYFRTMGMSLQAGRLFSDLDREHQVAVVSNSVAARAWQGEDPIGKRIHFPLPAIPDREVVGIVNDVRGVSLEAGPSLSVYLPYWQGLFARGQAGNGSAFAVKTTRDVMAMAPAIRAAIRSIDTELPLSTIRTMDEVVQGSVLQRRFQATLVLMFAGAAVLLASLGVSGVLSYAVTQRTTEIGIRLALGAERGAVLRLVLRQALLPVVMAVASAVPLALLAGSWLRSLLFGVSPRDPVTIGAACLVLLTAAVLAAYLPARRAANLDPLTALRHE